MTLVCANRRLFTLEAIRRSGRFAVNLLDGSGEHLARRFAGSGREDRFKELNVSPGSLGLPIVRPNAGYAECQAVDYFVSGEHVIVVGLMLNAFSEAEGSVLYSNRGTFSSAVIPQITQ